MVRRTSILILFLLGAIAPVFQPVDQAQAWPAMYSIVEGECPAPVEASDPESRTRTVSEATQQRHKLQRVSRIATGVAVIPVPDAPRRHPRRGSIPVPLPPEFPATPPRAPPTVS